MRFEPEENFSIAVVGGVESRLLVCLLDQLGARRQTRGDCKGRTGQGCAIMLEVVPEGQEQIWCMVARQALQVGVTPEALRDMMALSL